ncbi:uncharacterized protein LOC142232178 [Haematobia irritans]|uniref:uncharacterized protein LOC142229174 n=1 Tax=Haematobia irritans TaxID=7368 RepID=UPI003F4F59A5
MEKSNTSSVPKCKVCHERHFLKDCLTFSKMTVIERREITKQKNFCFNCLCASHTREWCPSRKTCIVCNRHHHTMLHTEYTPQSHQQKQSFLRSIYQKSRRSPSTSTRTKQNEHNRKAASSQRKSSSKSYVSDRLSNRNRTHIFLPTALARVLSPQGPMKARLILNSGAAQTVISTGLVERLRLPTTYKGNKRFCTINLLSYHDKSAKVQISGEVRSQLNTTFPEATTDKKLMNVYNHLTDLADPNFFNPTNIEIMLANDLIPHILRAGLIQTSTSMPIAQSTVFGWTISGPCHF